ncbi:hypothetical protein XAC1083_770007 [Xanthomonas citri pv. citri]|nr:hypothetical protein XAC1083_770007 [Xanthomonas citri pv. citri]
MTDEGSGATKPRDDLRRVRGNHKLATAVMRKCGLQERHEALLPLRVETDFGLVYQYQRVVLNVPCDAEHQHKQALLTRACSLKAERLSSILLHLDVHQPKQVLFEQPQNCAKMAGLYHRAAKSRDATSEINCEAQRARRIHKGRGDVEVPQYCLQAVGRLKDGCDAGIEAVPVSARREGGSVTPVTT